MSKSKNTKKVEAGVDPDTIKNQLKALDEKHAIANNPKPRVIKKSKLDEKIEELQRIKRELHYFKEVEDFVNKFSPDESFPGVEKTVANSIKSFILRVKEKLENGEIIRS